MLINVTHSMSCKQGPTTLKNLKTKTPKITIFMVNQPKES